MTLLSASASSAPGWTTPIASPQIPPHRPERSKSDGAVARAAIIGGSADDATVVLRAALSAERLRGARLLNGVRLLVISAFFSIALVMGPILRQPNWTGNNWPLFSAYLATAGLLLLLSRSSDTVARVSAVAIPAVDMPALVILQRDFLVHIEESVARGHVVGATAALFILLIIGATATLDRRVVFAATAIAVTLQLVLEHVAAVAILAGPLIVAVMVLAGAGCSYVIIAHACSGSSAMSRASSSAASGSVATSHQAWPRSLRAIASA